MNNKTTPFLFSALLSLMILAGCLVMTAPLAAQAAEPEGTADKVSGYVNDSGITTAIKGKFLAQKGLDSLDLNVVTKNGVVTLRGQVLKEEQRDLAVKIARETKGVRKVVNKISVMP